MSSCAYDLDDGGFDTARLRLYTCHCVKEYPRARSKSNVVFQSFDNLRTEAKVISVNVSSWVEVSKVIYYGLSRVIIFRMSIVQSLHYFRLRGKIKLT
jgi:hypothetical protein